MLVGRPRILVNAVEVQGDADLRASQYLLRVGELLLVRGGYRGSSLGESGLP
jgi:hypothetical protein